MGIWYDQKLEKHRLEFTDFKNCNDIKDELTIVKKYYSGLVVLWRYTNAAKFSQMENIVYINSTLLLHNDALSPKVALQYWLLIIQAH